MDRFYWYNGKVDANERHLGYQNNVRLYDGEDKTTFDCGTLSVTNLRLIWTDEQQKDRSIAFHLQLVKKMEFEGSSLFKSAKIVVHLLPPPKEKPSGPKQSSQFNHIKLSFRVGGQDEFGKAFRNAISLKDWEKLQIAASPSKPTIPQISHRHVGIGGIERKMEEKYAKTDQSINQAFQDLDALIEKAKDMVTLAEKFSSKLKDKEVSITDDETIAFKSYLLSMGIDNPVTRETHGSGGRYHEELAKQLATFLLNIIEDEGGVITLTDVYCRFNRARGMELVSPDDVLNACNMFANLKLPLRLRKFDSGVLVVISLRHTEDEFIETTTRSVIEEGSLTADELSRILGLTITLSKERLLLSERAGKICRDDSVEGLRFYPNKFVEVLT